MAGMIINTIGIGGMTRANLVTTAPIIATTTMAGAMTIAATTITTTTGIIK